ncbi:MAG TPA: hypothetical protein VIQ11_21900 [Mycobacterium sp.]
MIGAFGSEAVVVYGTAIQRRDGTVDTGESGEHEVPSVSVVSIAESVTTAQARELAALILRTADEVDAWVTQ